MYLAVRIYQLIQLHYFFKLSNFYYFNKQPVLILSNFDSILDSFVNSYLSLQSSLDRVLNAIK